MKTPIPNTLREHRKKAALRQLDVACKLGFNNTDRISRWEQGLSLPNVVNLFKLSALYQISANELYPGLIEEPDKKSDRNYY